MGRWTRLALTLSVVAGLALVAYRALDPVPETGTQQITVVAGDTLWAIARRTAPDRDPRAVVDQIERANHLGEGVLQIGTVLVVPAGG